MDKEFQFIDTSGAKQTVRASSSEQAMQNATNIAPNSGVMAVDTLSRPADQNVQRAVQTVNNVQSQQPSPLLTQDVAGAIATLPPQEKPLTQTEQDRQTLRDTATEIMGTDIVAQRQQARQDAGVNEKEERARTLSNQLIARERQIQSQREELEKNARGQSEFALQSDIARFNRESARELADLSFSYQVALGDYQSAEKIANDYIQDFQAGIQAKQQAWQMLFTMVQNDMTESEKLIAQQNFAREQAQEQFEMEKKMAQFNSTLRQQEASVQFARQQQAQTAQQQQLMSLFGGGSTGNFISFDEYLNNAQEEAGMSFTPQRVQELQQQYQQQISMATEENKMSQITQAVMSGLINPQQANFMIENMQITTPQQQQRQANVIETGRGVLRDVDRSLELVKSAGPLRGILGERGIKSGAWLPTQIAGGVLTPKATQLAQHLESVKSNISIEELQRMREASPTGGALGQVPVQQQEFLMSVKGSLKPTLKSSVLEENLNDLYNIYLDAMFGSPQELSSAVQRGRMTVQEANAYLNQRKQSSFDDFNLPNARSGGQDISTLVIAPDGSLVRVTQ